MSSPSSSSSAETASQRYHQATKYHPETIARQSRPLDWSSQPDTRKSYPHGRVLSLEPYLIYPLSVEANPSLAAEHKDIIEQRQRLARLLTFSYGITAIAALPGRRMHLRASPSAGGLYPSEIYLLSRGDGCLPEGIYNYQVANSSLVQCFERCDWPGLQEACFHHPALSHTSLALAITVVFERSAWRYEDRAYRRICLDAGHLLGNIELASVLSNYRVSTIGEFCDGRIESLLAINGREEGPMAVLPIHDHPELAPEPQVYQLVADGDRDPSACLPPPTLQPGEWLAYLHERTRIGPQASNQTPQWRTLSAADQRHHGAARNRDKYNFPFCTKFSTSSPGIPWGNTALPLAKTLLRRRSARQLTGEAIDLDQLHALLDFAYHPEHYADCGFDAHPDYLASDLVETFVVVNNLDALEPGCYYYAADADELRQIRFKDFRQELHYLCLGQSLGRDAAIAIVHTASLEQAVKLYGDRSYRYLHLDAGHLGQRLNLAAVRLGLGASGIAGFFDDRVNEVLGIPEDDAILYLTAIGQIEPTS